MASGTLLNVENGGTSKYSIDYAGNSTLAGNMTINGTGTSTMAGNLTLSGGSSNVNVNSLSVTSINPQGSNITINPTNTSGRSFTVNGSTIIQGTLSLNGSSSNLTVGGTGQVLGALTTNGITNSSGNISTESGTLIQNASDTSTYIGLTSNPLIQASEAIDLNSIGSGINLGIDTATTNLVYNPSFEIDAGGATSITGYSSIGSPTTYEIVTTPVYSGSNSAEVAGGTGSGIEQVVYGLNTNTTYTASVYVNISSGSIKLTSLTSGVNTNVITSPLNTWQREVITFTTGGTQTSETIELTAQATGTTFYTDSWQVEQGLSATPYTDGSIGLGTSWSGSGLTAPSGVTATGVTTGGTLTSGTYYYKVSATSSTVGESGPSSEVSASITTSTGSVNLSWSSVTGATGYRVYRGSSSGGENTYYTITGGGTTTYTDTGSTGTGGIAGGGTNGNSSTRSAEIAIGTPTNITFAIAANGNVATEGNITSNGSAKVTGSVSANGGLVYGGSLQGSGNGTLNGSDLNVSGLVAPTSLTSSGITNIGGSILAGTYHYEVVAYNGSGQSFPSASISVNLTTQVSAPVSAPTLSSTANAGSTVAAGTYTAVYTYTTANGETTQSPASTSITVASGYNIIVTMPSLPTGVTGENVYIATSPSTTYYYE